MKDEWFPFVTKDDQGEARLGHVLLRQRLEPARARPGRRAGAPARPGAGGAARPGAGAWGARARRVTRAAGGACAQWATFEHVPRFHNNYVGLRNRFALLSEAYAYATFEDRIKATNYFLEEALTFAHQNAARLKRPAPTPTRRPSSGQVEATRAQMKRGGIVDILMGEVEDEKNPNNGAVMNRRKDVVHTEAMIDMMWFEPSATEDVPATYYVPAEATKALDLLRAHGVQMRR